MKTSLLLALTCLASTAPLSVVSATTAAAASAENQSACFGIADVDQVPKAVKQFPPVYPAQLKDSKITGEAVVSFVVDVNGKTRDLTCIRETHAGFADASIAAVSQWQFEPAIKSGRAVSCRLVIPIVFSLAN